MKKKIITKILDPRVLLPFFLTVAFFTIALKIGDVGQVLPRIADMPPFNLGLVLLLAVSYLFFKAVQLIFLLRSLGENPSRNHLMLAYSIGELSLTLPMGIFLQNWVFSRTGSGGFGRTSAATVMMLFIETFVVLSYLAINPISNWPQVRPAAIFILIGLMLVILFMILFKRVLIKLADKISKPWLSKSLIEIISLLDGMKKLLNIRLIFLNFLLATLYLSALSLAFYFVSNAVLLPRHLFLTQTTTIYAFSLAVVLVLGGVVSQLGTVELIGMVVAKTWGINFSDGLAMMLGFRLIWTGSIWLLNLPVVVALWPILSPDSTMLTNQHQQSKKRE